MRELVKYTRNVDKIETRKESSRGHCERSCAFWHMLKSKAKSLLLKKKEHVPPSPLFSSSFWSFAVLFYPLPHRLHPKSKWAKPNGSSKESTPSQPPDSLAPAADAGNARLLSHHRDGNLSHDDGVMAMNRALDMECSCRLDPAAHHIPAWDLGAPRWSSPRTRWMLCEDGHWPPPPQLIDKANARGRSASSSPASPPSSQTPRSASSSFPPNIWAFFFVVEVMYV
jgi:hypothetical protein